MQLCRSDTVGKAFGRNAGRGRGPCAGTNWPDYKRAYFDADFRVIEHDGQPAGRHHAMEFTAGSGLKNPAPEC